MLIDSHAHLDLPEFNNDREEIIAKAKENEISHILTVGINLKSSKQAVRLADSHDFIYASIGIHPHDTKQIDEHTYSALKSLSSNEKVIAYGEIGLDFFRNLSPREVQIGRFREQIALAGELGLPLIIHDRDAHREVFEILKEERAQDVGGIIHCFSGDYSMAKKCMDMGFYISIPGTVTFPKARDLQAIVEKLPLSRILTETDCPFLAPVPRRGKRNEPSFVRYVSEKIASLKGISFEEVAEVTSRNFMDLFGLSSSSKTS